jgi:3' exoribonuclease, RNase T-like
MNLEFDFVPVFIDTEFLSFETPELLSIGAITLHQEDSFYRELSDPCRAHMCSDFVKEHVIPLFDMGEVHKESAVVIGEWSEWLLALKQKYGKPLLLISDAPTYDVQPLDLWGQRHEVNVMQHTLPKLGWFQCNSTDIDLEGLYYHKTKKKYRAHHALDDARFNAIAFKTLGGTIFKV